MKKLFLFLAVLLLPLLSIHGQEKTEWLYSLRSEKSIIREITDGKWLVYSDASGPLFSLVVDGSPNVYFFFLSDVFESVSDFEIDGDSAYFCGMLKSGVPAMGIFDHTALSVPTPYAPTVVYTEFSGADELIGIEIMEADGCKEKHVVMIGKQNGMGILVDALPIATGWNAYYILLLDKFYNYTIHDDLAITDSDVVVTSYIEKNEPDRDTLFSIAQGYIWLIKKPYGVGVPLTANPPFYVYVPYIKRYSPFVVASCEGNACVAATMAFAKTPSSYVPGINVYGCIGKNVVHKVRLGGITTLDVLKDICYDPLSQTTELLTRRKNNTVDESLIYTLWQSSATATSVQGHRYADQRLNSLIHQSPNSNQFIGSGVDINNNYHLFIYRYNNNEWDTCTSSVECTAKEMECGTPVIATSQYFNINHTRRRMETTLKETLKEVICGQTNKRGGE